MKKTGIIALLFVAVCGLIAPAAAQPFPETSGPDQCQNGYEYDSRLDRCVAVSCDAPTACEDGEVCMKVDTECIRSPCPQYDCVAELYLDDDFAPLCLDCPDPFCPSHCTACILLPGGCFQCPMVLCLNW